MDGDLKQPEWKVGTAVVDITPRESMWLAGWAARREPANGTATPLYAKALAIEDAAGTKLVICTVDLIAVTREIVEPVAAEINKRLGVERRQLLFNASHTHTGPEIRPDKVPFFGIPEEYALKIEPYRAWLVGELVQLISEALSAMQPAQLVACHASASFAENRRKPPGPVDYDVPVLAVKDITGIVRAVSFGYACHNLTLPPSFVQYCAEYCGIARESIEQEFPGAGTFFISGAGADIDPAKRPRSDAGKQFQEMLPEDEELVTTMCHGLDLASAVVRAIHQGGRSVAGLLRIAYSETLLDFEPLPSRNELEADLVSEDPPRRVKARYLLDALESGKEFPTSYPCPLQVVSFGEELLLIAMSAEPVVQFALDFKKQYGPGMVWVAGYCNDMFGYIATQGIQKQGGYEGGRATLWSALPGPFTRDTEGRVREAVDELVKRVRPT